jgi:hypothetical protein
MADVTNYRDLQANLLLRSFLPLPTPIREQAAPLPLSRNREHCYRDYPRRLVKLSGTRSRDARVRIASRGRRILLASKAHRRLAILLLLLLDLSVERGTEIIAITIRVCAGILI